MKKSELTNIFEGFNNANVQAASERILRGKTYQDLSTVWITPTRGVIPATVTSSWFGLMRPMNQKFVGPVYIEGMEVGDAYNSGIEMVLNHPDLSKYKYLLTVEEDNCPPADGLLKLYESIGKYGAVSGLYWTKSIEAAQPMCYGEPLSVPRNYIPQPPPIDCVKEYNGIGQGFALYRLEMFKKVPKPWFKTVQSQKEGMGTQDLYFCQRASECGFRFAVDGRVKVGHWSQEERKMY